MSSVIRAPQQRITKSLVALAGIGGGSNGPVHRLANFSAQLAEYATAVSATLYTVPSQQSLQNFLGSLSGGGNNFYVPSGNVVTDMGKTVTVQVVGNASVSAEFQLVAVDAADSYDSATATTGRGYINTKITRGDGMDQSEGLTYFARI